MFCLLANCDLPEDRFSDIVFNNWLLNPSGRPNAWVEVDLAQEHMNFWIKVRPLSVSSHTYKADSGPTQKFYKAHGSNTSWEWLGLVSPCVGILRHLANSMKKMLGSDSGNKHAPPDLSDDIKTLMDSLDEHNVYRITKGRVTDEDDPPVPDITAVGVQTLTDSSSNPLAEYNKAFRRLQARRRMKPVVDDDFGATSQPASHNGAQLAHTLAVTETPTHPPPIQPNDPATSPAGLAEFLHPIPGPSDSTEVDVEDNMDAFEKSDDEGWEDFEDDEEDEFTRLVNEADEPTLERLTADDVAMDMDVIDVVDDSEEYILDLEGELEVEEEATGVEEDEDDEM